jgi:hypothetical protein
MMSFASVSDPNSFDVQQLVPYTAVERLDIGILPWAAELDVGGVRAGEATVVAQCPRDHLRAVVGAEIFRCAKG